MSVPKGYAGNVAIIDLGKQEAHILPTERFWKDYGIDPGFGWEVMALSPRFSGKISPPR